MVFGHETSATTRNVGWQIKTLKDVSFLMFFIVLDLNIYFILFIHFLGTNFHLYISLSIHSIYLSIYLSIHHSYIPCPPPPPPPPTRPDHAGPVSLPPPPPPSPIPLSFSPLYGDSNLYSLQLMQRITRASTSLPSS